MALLKTRIFLLGFLLLVACKKQLTQTSIDNPEDEIASSNENKEQQFVAKKIGDTLDVYNDIAIFYNKSMNNTMGRHLSSDGYNLGLKWQCVEFVKRYYCEYLNHKMPNSYGHAKDFYNASLKDGAYNKDRNLLQFKNGSSLKPKVNDLVIFDGNLFNSYGHVAIISKVEEDRIEIVQQNVGRNSRDTIDLIFKNGKWYLDDSNLLGWLRKE